MAIGANPSRGFAQEGKALARFSVDVRELLRCPLSLPALIISLSFGSQLFPPLDILLNYNLYSLSHFF